MIIIMILLLGVLTFLVGVTFYYFQKQRSMKRKRRKGSKYEVLELSEKDHQYDDYYEPEIVEVVSSEEYL